MSTNKMVINKKISRSMLESKSQYLGSVLLIIISCLLYTMLNQLSSNMGKMTADFEKNYVQEDASFVTGIKLNNIPELEAKFNARIEENGVFDYDIAKGKTLRLFSQNTKVNISAIIEGSNLSGNDILIDPAFAKANNLKIGSELQILNKAYKIAGYMSLPNYIYPLKSENDIMSSPDSFGIAVISKDDFSKIKKGSSFYSIKFNTTGDKNGVSGNSKVEALASEFRDYLKSRNIIISQWTDIGDNMRVAFVSTKIQSIRKVSSTIPVAILLLTCILTGIVIWRLLNKESAIIGTLYAQGYRRKEIYKHYLLYPIIIALTGGITGTILGAFSFKPMLELMVQYFNMPISNISFNLVYILASILLPILFLVISGAFVLNRELRYSPLELMRGRREKNKVNFIERRLTLDKLKFSFKFKIRQQLRSLSRLLFLLIGVVMATMLLLLGFTAKSSMDYLMKDSLRNTYKFQYEYVFNVLHSEKPPVSTETFSAVRVLLSSNNKTKFEICGIDPGSSFLSLKDKAGNELSKQNTIITRPLAAKLNVVPGDRIEVINTLDSKEYSVTVGSIAETYAGEYIFLPIAQFNETFRFPADSYMGLWSNAKLDIPEDSLYSATSIDESVKDFNATLQPVQSTVGVISFMSFIIGLIVIYVVTSLIIEENKGNISLMKVFGYRRKELNSLILDSSSIVIVAGYIIGIPLIMASMSAMFKSMAESIKFTLPVKISYPYIFAGFIVVYLTYELSKALSKKKISRISMSEALKSGME